MGRGQTLLISNRTANTWPCMEDVYLVEGGAVVHVGIRDIIVNVERRRTALTTIVSVSPTQADTKTGTKDHTLGRKTSAKVIKKSDVKKSKSYFLCPWGLFFLVADRQRRYLKGASCARWVLAATPRVLCSPCNLEDTQQALVAFRPLRNTLAPMATRMLLRRGRRRSPRRHTRHHRQR